MLLFDDPAGGEEDYRPLPLPLVASQPGVPGEFGGDDGEGAESVRSQSGQFAPRCFAPVEPSPLNCRTTTGVVLPDARQRVASEFAVLPRVTGAQPTTIPEEAL